MMTYAPDNSSQDTETGLGKTVHYGEMGGLFTDVSMKRLFTILVNSSSFRHVPCSLSPVLFTCDIRCSLLYMSVRLSAYSYLVLSSSLCVCVYI